MKLEEVLAEKHLKHQGHTKIEYEPDGGVTPDFLVDDRSADRRVLTADRPGARHRLGGGAAIPLPPQDLGAYFEGQCRHSDDASPGEGKRVAAKT